MRVLSRLYGATSTPLYETRLVSDAPQAQNPRQMYRLLEAYYQNNGLYDVLAQWMYEEAIRKEGMKPLRNPAYRVVEFYVSHLWPGALPKGLPIVAENKRLEAPIEQVWTWSNWGTQKQVATRWLAMFGDLFIKVVQPTPAPLAPQGGENGRVYFEQTKPELVSDFDVDERGYVTFIRLDVPRKRRTDAGVKPFTHTEVWNRDEGTFRVWEHERGTDAELDALGTPTTEKKIEEFGIDFVPFVHAKFKDVGEKRGVGSYTLQLDKIDEANRQATRLHQMLFRHNKALWALEANAMDSSGRPLPAPRVGGASQGEDGDTIELGDDRLLRLPGMSTIRSMVPDIKYDAALSILNAQLEELERDLPELAYYRLRDMREISGRAVRMLLSDAVDNVIEARGNAETALTRADAMALTMGAAAGLEGFKGIGTYEAGDFEHVFKEREVIPITKGERLEMMQTAVSSGMPLTTAMREAGWSDEEIDQMMADKQAEAAASQTELAQALLAAERRFDQGQAV